MDPLAEKYRRLSPYNYGDDEPLSHIDPDGMDLVRVSVPANSNGSKQKEIVVDKNVAGKILDFTKVVNKEYGYTVNSAFRSKTKQAAMRARWDAGDRSGLRFQPAKKSAHSAGMAIDFNMPKNVSKEALTEFNDFAAKSGFKPVKGDVGHYMLDETKNGYKNRDEAMDVNDKYEKNNPIIPTFGSSPSDVVVPNITVKDNTMQQDNVYVVSPTISKK